MTGPLSRVNHEMDTFISQIEQGKAPNPTKLLQIENELKVLVQDDKIPKSVKESLNQALQKLTAEDSIDLYGAKTDVGEAMEKGKKDHPH